MCKVTACAYTDRNHIHTYAQHTHTGIQYHTCIPVLTNVNIFCIAVKCMSYDPLMTDMPCVMKPNNSLSQVVFHCHNYRKTSSISRTLVGNKIVDNSDVVGASPVGAAPTTSSFST